MVVSKQQIGLTVTTRTRYYLLSFARDVHCFVAPFAVLEGLISHFGKTSRVFVVNMPITI